MLVAADGDAKDVRLAAALASSRAGPVPVCPSRASHSTSTCRVPEAVRQQIGIRPSSAKGKDGVADRRTSAIPSSGHKTAQANPSQPATVRQTKGESGPIQSRGRFARNRAHTTLREGEGWPPETRRQRLRSSCPWPPRPPRALLGESPARAAPRRPPAHRLRSQTRRRRRQQQHQRRRPPPLPYPAAGGQASLCAARSGTASARARTCPGPAA